VGQRERRARIRVRHVRHVRATVSVKSVKIALLLGRSNIVLGLWVSMSVGSGPGS